MSAIITNQFRKNSRELFIDDFSTSNYFIGIGKSEPWPTINGIEESNINYSVPLPTNTIVEKSDVLKNLISLLKVQETFAVIPRNEWVSGRVYKVYDPSDPNIFNYETIGSTAYYPCYMTHNNHVFVCLNNNNDGPSTTNVTAATFTIPSELTDGYVWAYVCSLNTTSNFYTDQFVDISADITDPTDISDAVTATGGLVYGFKVIDGGSGLDGQEDILLVGKDSNGAVKADVTLRSGGNDVSPYSVTIASGTIIDISFATDNFPNDYSEASIIVVGKDTNIQPLVAPIDGFGYSPRSDLPSFYAGLYASYVGAEGGEAPINIGFRQVSLIKDPTRTDNDTPADDSLDIYDTLQYLGLSSVEGITADAGTIIEHTSNGAKAYLDYVDSANSRVYYHQNSNGDINQKPFETGNVNFTTPGGTTSASFTINALGDGEYDQGSGKTLFLENRKAILRNSNQQEDIKLVIQF